MNTEKLEGSTAELLQFITETAKAGKNFALEQAPLVCQEIVAYGRVYCTLGVIIALLLLVPTVIITKKCLKECPEAAIGPVLMGAPW